jgi:DNA-directed RNA polymerase subunit RPC12/RpoP
VSDSSKNLMEIYDDIDLCYKVMGLTFSDPPDKVDKVYRGLLDKYNRDAHSQDLALRNKANDNLEQLQDLYERITNSMIYKDYAREYEKYKILKSNEVGGGKENRELEKDLMVNCPYCNKKINQKLKVCLYCHGKILTPIELLIYKTFNKRNMFISGIVLILLIFISIITKYPQIINSFK